VLQNGVLYDKEMTSIVIYPRGRSGSFVIPDTVTSIDLELSPKLTSVTIGKGITSIESNAFGSCTSLTSVTIPDSVTDISSRAFYGCDSLTTFEVDPNNEKYKSYDGVIFDKNMTTIMVFPPGKSGAYIIPDSVTSIQYSNFEECNKLTSLTCGKGIKIIDSFAITSCEQLTEITISESLWRYGEYAVYSNRQLKKIEVSDENPYFMSDDGVLFNKQKTTLLAYPVGREGGYSIPESVTTIASAAFYGARFETMNVGKSVKKIEDSAFMSCPNLKSMVIGKSVTHIGTDVFCENNNLTSLVYFGTSNPGADAKRGFCEKTRPKICVPAEYSSNIFCGAHGLSDLSECEVPPQTSSSASQSSVVPHTSSTASSVAPHTSSTASSVVPQQSSSTAPKQSSQVVVPSSSDVLMPCLMHMALIAVALACLF